MKSCTSDPSPIHTFKVFIQEVLPFITDMWNASLEQDRYPVSQRHAVITPRLKKAAADPADAEKKL